MLKKPRRIFRHLAVPLIVLTVLTGCQRSSGVSEPSYYAAIVLDMVPKLPEVPVFPVLHWTEENGKYCISASDADALLDYGENQMPMFRHELMQYEKKLEILLESLR